MIKFPRILYFIGSPAPTEEEIEDAKQFGHNTAFRNAGLVDLDGNVEICEGVAGMVPENYKKKYPHASEVLTAFLASQKKKKPEVVAAPAIKAAPAAPVIVGTAAPLPGMPPQI